MRSPILETMFDFNQRLVAVGSGSSPQLVAAENNNEEEEHVEMDARDVPPDAFEQLLNYFYSKEVALTGETVFAVLATGDEIFSTF
jgi:hypothetical protein